jgi:hypothetical protein
VVTVRSAPVRSSLGRLLATPPTIYVHRRARQHLPRRRRSAALRALRLPFALADRPGPPPSTWAPTKPSRSARRTRCPNTSTASWFPRAAAAVRPHRLLHAPMGYARLPSFPRRRGAGMRATAARPSTQPFDGAADRSLPPNSGAFVWPSVGVMAPSAGLPDGPTPCLFPIPSMLDTALHPNPAHPAVRRAVDPAQQRQLFYNTAEHVCRPVGL